MSETRIRSEGALRWVQASGSGATWTTANAPASGVFGYVESFSYTSAQTVETVRERGIPSHHKLVSKEPVELTVNFLWTGAHPVAASGGGASLPLLHLEFRADEPENDGSGRYYQYYGAALTTHEFNEAEDGDTIELQFVALGMNGPTASGYLG